MKERPPTNWDHEKYPLPSRDSLERRLTKLNEDILAGQLDSKRKCPGSSPDGHTTVCTK